MYTLNSTEVHCVAYDVDALRSDNRPGGNLKLIILTRRFKSVNWTDSETCPCLENAMGAGGGNIPMVLESTQNHAVAKHSEICPTLSASMGMGGGYVPMIAETNDRKDNCPE